MPARAADSLWTASGSCGRTRAQGVTPVSLDPALARRARVPAPIQADDDDLHHYTGPAWYQRTFELTPDWLAGRVVILGFGAADYFAEVWLNGVRIGAHEGGYLPFELDASAAARPGLNTITVRITDPTELFAEIPHDKQSWYGP